MVRINDLARELEVKSKAVLDALPLVGITEKKTHSSSLEEHEADKVRVYIRGSPEAETPSARSIRLLRGEEEIKTRIDLSHISRPGDVLKAITHKKSILEVPKVRIIDLARELEVKSEEILDVLPLIGVKEKKTCHSFLEDHEAEEVRGCFCVFAETQTPTARSARPLRGEEENKTKIDLSQIHRPTDALKQIFSTQKTETQTSTSPRPRSVTPGAPRAPQPPALRVGAQPIGTTVPAFPHLFSRQHPTSLDPEPLVKPPLHPSSNTGVNEQPQSPIAIKKQLTPAPAGHRTETAKSAGQMGQARYAIPAKEVRASTGPANSIPTTSAQPNSILTEPIDAVSKSRLYLIWGGALEQLRLLLMEFFEEIEPLPPGQDMKPGKRLGDLMRKGKLPEDIEDVLRTVINLRNRTSYEYRKERKIPTPSQVNVLTANLNHVIEWAEDRHLRTASELRLWVPPTIS